MIVGLGNPGRDYATSRHNIGWMVASALCNLYKKHLKSTNDLCYQTSMTIGTELVLVALPTTYMNNSGEAVSYLKEKYDLPDAKIVVICDEYNFPWI